MEIQHYQNKIIQMRGSERVLLKQKEQIANNVRELQQLVIDIEEAQKIAQDVAIATQSKLKMAIEPIVTSALDIVFRDDAYAFTVDFDVKSNKTVCEFSFTRGGSKFLPMDSSGYGAVDIAAFALRLALWNISKPRTRNTFILDEPFKHLSADLQERAFEMTNELCKRLEIQVILVSHSNESDVFDYSDKVFRVNMGKDKISRIKILKGG